MDRYARSGFKAPFVVCFGRLQTIQLDNSIDRLRQDSLLIQETYPRWLLGGGLEDQSERAVGLFEERQRASYFCDATDIDRAINRQIEGTFTVTVLADSDIDLLVVQRTDTGDFNQRLFRRVAGHEFELMILAVFHVAGLQRQCVIEADRGNITGNRPALCSSIVRERQ